jgi:DNA-binding winged helix-turn-helix (wHTH) protein/Tol biopolymer transport system component
VATPVSTDQTWRFGAFEVDTRKVELRRDGKPVKIREQSFLILVYLLEHAGEIVTREELCRALWPSDTFVDFDHSLNMAVMKLRETLGESSDTPLYFETIPRRGYRFIAPVSQAGDVPIGTTNGRGESAWFEMKGADGTHQVAAAPGRRTRLWPLVAAALIVGFLASAIWYLNRPPLPPRVTYNQITHDGRNKWLVGTDGARLYFVRWLEPQRVGQVSISGGDVVPVAVPLPYPTPKAVSPDGSTLLIGSALVPGSQGSLWSFGVLGGSLRHLADGQIGSATWSPDGKLIIYSTLNGDIDVMRSDGSESHRIPAAEDHTLNSIVGQISWSPDGSKIRFSRNGILFEMLPDGSGLHPLLPGWHPSSSQCCPAGSWSPDGRFFSFSAQNEIWVLEERGRPFRRGPTNPVQLTSGPILWGGFVFFGKDSKTLFATGSILRGEVNRFDSQSHLLRPWLGGISAEFFTFSPDGKSLAYVTFPEGILFRANLDGSNPVQLTDPSWHPTLLRWSPDGTQILFSDQDAAGHSKSYVIPSGGGTPRPLLPEDKEAQSDPNWSPDGSKVVFSSSLGGYYSSHPVEKILDLASHKVSTLPGSEGTRSPRWSPDGRFISVLYGDDSLKIFNLSTQRWSVLRENETGFETWSRDSQFIYFVTRQHDPGVYRMRISSGDTERLVDLNGFRHTGWYTLWFGLDSKDTPMLLRDVGTQDIYALRLEQR